LTLTIPSAIPHLLRVWRSHHGGHHPNGLTVHTQFLRILFRGLHILLIMPLTTTLGCPHYLLRTPNYNQTPRAIRTPLQVVHLIMKLAYIRMVKGELPAQSVRKSETSAVQTTLDHTNLQLLLLIPLWNLRKHILVESHQCRSRSPLQLCRPFLMKRGASRSSRLRVARQEKHHPIHILSLRALPPKKWILVSPL
jgi:hypothetical protein